MARDQEIEEIELDLEDDLIDDGLIKIDNEQSFKYSMMNVWKSTVLLTYGDIALRFSIT